MAKETTNQEEQTKEQNEVRSALETNLRFYNQGRSVPGDALKEIRAGRLKGMSDINPMWRMKRLTEIFGPVGFGWKYTIDRQWVEEYVTETSESRTLYQPQVLPQTDGQGKIIRPGIAEKPETIIKTRKFETKCFCNVSLFVRDPETKEWSEAIPGVGGSAVVSVESKGPYVNDEAYKMALTDALSIAMKPLGIGADIWYGTNATGHNESKYERYTRTDTEPKARPSTVNSTVAYTGAQLQQAIAEMNAVGNMQSFMQVWDKWATGCPAVCANGTEFYKAACDKRQSLSTPAAK